MPVLARAFRQWWSLLPLTAICTILTWVGYFLEPAGGPWWESVFDRGMITGVLWLTLLLVWRQMEVEALRDAMRKVYRSNAALADFSSAISHNVRGPLCSISMTAKILSTRAAVKADPECKDWIDFIVTEISQVNKLTEGLLSYARIGAGKVKLSECNCEAVLSSVHQSLRAELEEAGAELSHDPLPTVPADPALMRQLLQNLIENSIKYHGSNPSRIHVSATPTAEGWLFTVRDNGIGINSEDCMRIFDRFYQSAAAGCSTGSGLGLAICKRIVDCHGGRIEVRSEPGHGSTFSFVIPDSHKGASKKSRIFEP
ncbi:MAG TPA: ATP-binding protein [Nitrococcus sp.]|nr:ATP-binding protein [Nitrococcus sp.]